MRSPVSPSPCWRGPVSAIMGAAWGAVPTSVASAHQWPPTLLPSAPSTATTHTAKDQTCSARPWGSPQPLWTASPGRASVPTVSLGVNNTLVNRALLFGLPSVRQQGCLLNQLLLLISTNGVGLEDLPEPHAASDRMCLGHRQPIAVTQGQC